MEGVSVSVRAHWGVGGGGGGGVTLFARLKGRGHDIFSTKGCGHGTVTSTRSLFVNGAVRTYPQNVDLKLNGRRERRRGS